MKGEKEEVWEQRTQREEKKIYSKYHIGGHGLEGQGGGVVFRPSWGNSFLQPEEGGKSQRPKARLSRQYV